MKSFIKIYFADASSLADESKFNSIYNSLSEERRRKVDSFKQNKDKILCTAAGALLKKALSDYGVGEEKIILGEHGKPYLKNRNDLFFNLSHSENAVMCIVSNEECGCDIEKIREKTNNIAERYFSESEISFIDSEKGNSFFRIWTLKESYMKAVGKGFSLSLGDFSVVCENDKFFAVQNGERADYSFFEFDYSPEYCSSCCVRGNHEKSEAEIKTVDL